MILKDVMPELDKGSTVKRKKWGKSMYMRKADDGKLYTYMPNAETYNVTTEMLTESGWYILGQPEIKMLFFQAAPCTLTGSRIAHVDFADGIWLEYDPNARQLIKRMYKQYDYTMEFDDLIANDYEVV
jgi:hypothetical protein